MSPGADDITCRELVELVGEFLDDALPDRERARFEAHLGECEACRTYLEQIRQTIGAAGRLSEEQLQQPAREALLGTFRAWKREGGV